MSKARDKAKALERSPELGVESTYGELSDGLSEGGLSVGEDSAALTTLIDERQQQLFAQQDARLNELMKMVKALLDDTKRFTTLAPPLQGILNAREVLDRVEEYACTSKFLPGGEKFHVASLEAVFVAMAGEPGVAAGSKGDRNAVHGFYVGIEQ
eukprot:gene20452-24503_t